MKKEYIATVNINSDTLRKAKSSNVKISDSIHEALANSCIPYRCCTEAFPSTDYFEFNFEYVEGADFNKVLFVIKENLGLTLKLKPEEVNLTVISNKEKRTKS